MILQEGAVGSVGVSGLVGSADSDPSGESGTRSAGGHLLQHAHSEARAQHGGHTPSAQAGESALGRMRVHGRLQESPCF